MNKLVNTYLDAVDSLLAIHLKNPHPGHLPHLISDLADAVRAMNQEVPETIPKPLTLKDLKDQVNEEYARWCARQSVGKTELTDQLSVWSIGDFEIRRRKSS